MRTLALTALCSTLASTVYAGHVVVDQHQHLPTPNNASLPQIDLPSLGQVAALGSFSGLDVAHASTASRALGHARLDPDLSTLFARTQAGELFPAGATDRGGQIHAVCSLKPPDDLLPSPATGDPRSDAPQPLLTYPSNSTTAPPFLDAAAPMGTLAKGQVVFVGGNFSSIGNISANNIARWIPETGVWSSLSNGINGTVYALHCSSERASVVVAGDFASPHFTSSSGSDSSAEPDIDAYGGNVALWDGHRALWSPPNFGGLDGPVFALDAGLSNTSRVLFMGNFSVLWASSAVPYNSPLDLTPATAANSAWTLPSYLSSDSVTGLLAPVPWSEVSISGTPGPEAYDSAQVLRCPQGPDGPGSSFFLDGGGSITINFGSATEVRALRLGNSLVNSSGTTTFRVTPSTALGTDGTAGSSSALAWAYINPATGTGANCSTSCPLARYPGVPYTDFVLLNTTSPDGVSSTSTVAGLTLTLTGWTGSAPGLHSVSVLGPGGSVTANTSLNLASRCASKEPGVAGTSSWLTTFSPALANDWLTETYNAQTLQSVADGASNTTESYTYYSSPWVNASLARGNDPQVRAEYYPSVLAAGNYTAYIRVPPCSQTPDAGGCDTRTLVNVTLTIPSYAPANVPNVSHWAVVDQNVTALTTVSLWTGALGPRDLSNGSVGPIITMSLASSAIAPEGSNQSTAQFSLIADRLTLSLVNSTAAPVGAARSTGILEYDPWETMFFGPVAHHPPNAQVNTSAVLPAQLGSVSDRVGMALTASGAGRTAAVQGQDAPKVHGLAAVPSEQGLRDRVIVTGEFTGQAALLGRGGGANNQSSVDVASSNVTNIGRGTTFANMCLWSTGAPNNNVSAPLDVGSVGTGSLLSPQGTGLSNPALGVVDVPTSQGTLVYLAGNFAATVDGKLSLPNVAAYNVSADMWVEVPATNPQTFNATANGGNATQPPLGLGGTVSKLVLVQTPSAPGSGDPMLGVLGALQMPDLTGTGLIVGAQLLDQTKLAVSTWGGHVLWNVTGGSMTLPHGNQTYVYAVGDWVLPTNLLTANMTAGHGFDAHSGDNGAWERFPVAMFAGHARTLADTLAPGSALLTSSSYSSTDASEVGIQLASLNFSFVPPSLLYNPADTSQPDILPSRRSKSFEPDVQQAYTQPNPTQPWMSSSQVHLNLSALIPSSSNDALAVVRAGVYWTPLSARNESDSNSSDGTSDEHYFNNSSGSAPPVVRRGGWMAGLKPDVVQGSEPALLIMGGNFTSANNVSNLGLYDPTSHSLLPFPPLPFDVGAGRADKPQQDFDSSDSDSDSSSDSDFSSSGPTEPNWNTTTAYLISDVHALTVVNQTLFVGATGGLLIFDLYHGAWLENSAPLSRTPQWISPSNWDDDEDDYGWERSSSGGYLMDPPVVVRKLLPKPGAEVMVVVGDFDSAGSLPCASICLWDFTGGGPAGRWMQLGSGFQGKVLDVDFADADAEVLIVAGALTVANEDAALAMWSLYNGTWKTLGSVGPGEHQIPGPATAVAVNDLNLNSIFVAGVSIYNTTPSNDNEEGSSSESNSEASSPWYRRSTLASRTPELQPRWFSSLWASVKTRTAYMHPRAWYGSSKKDHVWPNNKTVGQPFLVKWDGTQFINMGSGTLLAGRVTELAILPILTAGPKTNVIQDNRVLAISGQFNLNASGPTAAALHDGARWIPFLTAQGPKGDPGAIMALARQNLRVTFADLHHLRKPVVVVISVFMSLGIVVLMVLLTAFGSMLFPSSGPGAIAARDTELQMHAQSPALSALRGVGSSSASLSNASMSTSLSPALLAATGTMGRRPWMSHSSLSRAALGTPSSGLRSRFARPKLPRQRTDRSAVSDRSATTAPANNDPSNSLLARLSDERLTETAEVPGPDQDTPRPPRTPSPLGLEGMTRDPLAGVPAAPLVLGRATERDHVRDQSHGRERKLSSIAAEPSSPPPASSGGMDLLAQLNAATEKVIRADAGGAEEENSDEDGEHDWDASPYNSDEDEPPPPPPPGRHPSGAVGAAMARAMQTFRHNQLQFDPNSIGMPMSPMGTNLPLTVPAGREQYGAGMTEQPSHPNPTMEGLLDHMELSDLGFKHQSSHGRNYSVGTTSTALDNKGYGDVTGPYALAGPSTTSFAPSLSRPEWPTPPYGPTYPQRLSVSLQPPAPDPPPPVARLLPTLRPHWTGGYTPTTPFMAYVSTRYTPPPPTADTTAASSQPNNGGRRPSINPQVEWTPVSLPQSSLGGSVRRAGSTSLGSSTARDGPSHLPRQSADSGMRMRRSSAGGDIGAVGDPPDTSQEAYAVHAGQEVEILSDHDPAWWVARDATGRIGALPVSILIV